MITAMRRLLWIALLAAACTTGCDRKTSGEPAAGSATATAYQPSGSKPANAKRAAPLPAMVASALDVGAKAPAVQLASVSGTTRGEFHLADVLAKERALIVFYRGDW